MKSLPPSATLPRLNPTSLILAILFNATLNWIALITFAIPGFAREFPKETVSGSAAEARPTQPWNESSESTADPDSLRADEPKSPTEWFGQTIRASEFRSPTQELQGFHVPKDFVVELVASEPQIAKPMNLAFDSQGRLWVSQSTLYPFPAPTNPSTNTETGDSIVRLEDRDRDGSFETKTLFADGLNIPIGVLPYGDGVLAFSIPNIYYLRDTDADGICDRREIILGPFDTSRDTHGMVNALRDGRDGWIYACHGFNNISKIQGTDGHSIELTSGNVFRFKPDGSRVELYTQGQVNPFGMTQDQYGFWFSADCHSKPITQLLRGGCYPSFGRPHDGLGFVPPTMDHLHGSTAISGLAYVNHPNFPPPLQHNLLSGNVMTCRINRNRLEYFGATAKAIEMPDLLTSDDPWFRPVDLQIGPDGALYVADFYNKIIGHYEVPLEHPDRDRTSGRIWRIRWQNPNQSNESNQSSANHDSNADPLAVNSREEAIRILESFASSEPQKDHSIAQTNLAIRRLRAIQQLGESGTLEDASRILEQIPSINPKDAILLQAHWIALRDIFGRLAKTQSKFPASLLALPKVLNNETEPALASRAQNILKVLQAVRDPAAARWSIDLLETVGPNLQAGWNTPWLRDALLTASTMVAPADIQRVLNLVESSLDNQLARTEQILRIAETQKERNGKLSEKLIELGRDSLTDATQAWMEQAASSGIVLRGWIPKPTRTKDTRDWPTEPRSLDQNSHPNPNQLPIELTQKPIPFWSSLPLSERYTGTWTSSPFIASKELSFWIVGHNGLPNEADRQENFVRILADPSRNGQWQEVHRVYPPRSDTARWVSLDLAAVLGSPVRVEVVDGCGLDSYAWIGIAELSEPGLARSGLRDPFLSLVRMTNCYGPAVFALERETQKKSGNPTQFQLQWNRLLQSKNLDDLTKSQLQTAMAGSQFPVIADLVQLIVTNGSEDLLHSNISTNPSQPAPTYRWDWENLTPASVLSLAEAFGKRANAPIQEELVQRWARHRSAFELLEQLIRKGALAKDALRTLPPAWWDSLPPEITTRFADLKPEGETDTQRALLVATKAQSIRALPTDLSNGKRVFEERCANCHQLRGVGKVIGPQLDGAVVRTIERLCEDILWSNRNVDEAFRITNIQTDDGESFSGLVLDRNDKTLEIIDQTGKSQRILRSTIEQEKVSKLSLMPSNFEELINDSELASLIAFLKSQAP